MQLERPRSESARSMECNWACFRYAPVAVATLRAYGEFTAAVISEIGRHITEAMGKSKETLWQEQRLSLAVRRGNALSTLTAVRERKRS